MTITFFKTHPTIFEDIHQLQYHQIPNITQMELLASCEYPHSRAPETIGEEANTCLYAVRSYTMTQEDIIDRYKQFGEPISFEQAYILGKTLQPDRMVPTYFPIDMTPIPYSFNFNLSNDDRAALRDMAYTRVDMISKRRAAMGVHLISIATLDPTYPPTNVFIDTLDDTTYIDMGLSTDYFHNTYDGDYIIQVEDGKSSMDLYTITFPIQANKIILAGYGVGTHTISVSNDGGDTWVETPMNPTSLTDEIEFQTTPTALKIRIITNKGSLPFQPFLTTWGFIWA